MKALAFVFVLCFFDGLMLRAEEASPGKGAVQSIADIPEGYEIGEKSLSPNGRFAILYPIRGDDTAELPPNLLVRLKPYSVLTRIGTEGGRWQGARDQPLAKWNGSSIVAIWIAARWGMKDLAVYEIEADEIKRIQPVWRQVWLLFDQDFRERFLSKYPDEKGSGVIFVSKGEGPDSKPELEFKGHKMLLSLFADNKPDLSVTPHWTASLHAVWNLDTAELEHVDFRPGPKTRSMVQTFWQTNCLASCARSWFNLPTEVCICWWNTSKMPVPCATGSRDESCRTLINISPADRILPPFHFCNRPSKLSKQRSSRKRPLWLRSAMNPSCVAP